MLLRILFLCLVFVAQTIHSSSLPPQDEHELKMESQIPGGPAIETGIIGEKDRYKLVAEQATKLALQARSQRKMEDIFKKKSIFSSPARKACKHFEKLVGSGGLDGIWALKYLGDIHYLGQKVDVDYAQALKYYEQAATAEPDNFCDARAWAQLALGDIYYSGQGVTVDYNRAREYYAKAQETRNINISIKALISLGNIYYLGQGVDVDYELAHGYYKTAIKWTDKEPDCVTPLEQRFLLMRLADTYFFGQGVKCDYEMARAYYQPVAEQTTDLKARAWARAMLSAL